MVIALDPRPATGSWTYVLRVDRGLPEEEQTVWTLRGLSVTEWARFHDRVSALVAGGGVEVAGFWEQMTELLRFGLVSVAGLRDRAGAEVEVTRGPDGLVSDDILSRMLPEHVVELGVQIQSRTTLSRDEVEKPAPSPAA